MYVGCLPKEKLDELINHLRRKRRKYVTRFVDEQKLEDTGQKQALRKVVSPTIRRKAPRRITQRRVLPTVLISEKLRERSRELKKEVFRSE
jgi:tRNA U54 and U55 pseudouridine synthase Pus10